MLDEDKICCRCVYHGRVHGVGFRWVTRRIASRHPVSGTVRNCSDGTVELIVQGDAAVIEECLQNIQKAFRQNIDACDRTELPELQTFDGFEIIS